MHLKSLTLRQFRNYPRLDMEPSPGLNLIIGPNGSGKSNLLEAVAVLATGQSHRGADPKHLAQRDTEGFALKGSFGGEEPLALEIRHRRGRPRQVLADGVAQKRLRDWVGRVPVVSFAPDDLHLVKGEPAVRRRLFNAVLAQVDADYLETLQRYNKVVAERNAALRLVQEGEEPVSVLEPWDAALLKDGAFLTLARRDFLEEFRPLVKDRHGALSGGKEKARLEYRPSFHLPDGDAASVTEANRRRLRDLRDGEVALGSTLVGPHRDDVEITLDGNPARAYASQGQQRTVALAVKFAERAYIAGRLRREPLCLLDDMLSELDPDRRRHLVDSLAGGAQCLVTLTEAAEWPGGPPRNGHGRMFRVSAGVLATAGAAS